MFPVEPHEFTEWCEERAGGVITESENMVGDQEIACVFSGVVGDAHDEEIFMTDSGGLVTRDDDATTKFRTGEMEIYMSSDSFQVNVIMPDESGDIEHIYDV